MVFSSESRSCLLLPTTALLLRALAITGNQNHNDQKNMASCNCPQILEKEMVFTSNKWYVLRSKWPLVVTEHPDDFWELPKVSPCESVSMGHFSVCHPRTAELLTSLKIFLVLNPTVFITVTLTWLHCNIFNECCSKWVATDFCSCYGLVGIITWDSVLWFIPGLKNNREQTRWVHFTWTIICHPSHRALLFCNIKAELLSIIRYIHQYLLYKHRQLRRHFSGTEMESVDQTIIC